MKLSAQQISDSYSAYDNVDVEEFDTLSADVNDEIYRTTVMRKEIRTRAQRERGEVVGYNESKHRKY